MRALGAKARKPFRRYGKPIAAPAADTLQCGEFEHRAQQEWCVLRRLALCPCALCCAPFFANKLAPLSGWCFVELPNDLVLLVQVFKRGKRFLKKPLSQKRQVPMAASALYDRVSNGVPAPSLLPASSGDSSMGDPRTPMPRVGVPSFNVEQLRRLQEIIDAHGVPADSKTYSARTPGLQQHVPDATGPLEIKTAPSAGSSVAEQGRMGAVPMAAELASPMPSSSPVMGESTASITELPGPSTPPRGPARPPVVGFSSADAARQSGMAVATQKPEPPVITLQKFLPTMRSILDAGRRRVVNAATTKANLMAAPTRTQQLRVAAMRVRGQIGAALRGWFRSPFGPGGGYRVLSVGGLDESEAAIVMNALRTAENCFMWRYFKNSTTLSGGTLEIRLHKGVDVKTWRLFWDAAFRS